jgi:hypothetical protein
MNVICRDMGVCVDIEQHIADLVERQSPVAVDGRIALDMFPDLKVFKDPQGADRWCSPTATPLASKCFVMVDLEGRVWMMPHLEERGIIVHSDPAAICVGRLVDAGFGTMPEPGWEEVMADFHPNAIRQVREYLIARPPVMW